MRIASFFARYLLGLIFTVFGLNGFLQFIHQPPPANRLAIQFLSSGCKRMDRMRIALKTEKVLDESGGSSRDLFWRVATMTVARWLAFFRTLTRSHCQRPLV